MSAARMPDWVGDLAKEQGLSPVNPEQITRTETALMLPAGLSFDAWQDIGRDLQRANRAILWWVGDWCNYGEHQYGEVYSQALEATPYAIQSLMNAASVARRFTISRRRENLGFALHAEVAYLDPESADALLDKAEELGWGQKALRAAVKAFKREHQRAVAAAKPAPDPEDMPETVHIEVADARALPLDDGIVDLIVTSPPYALAIDYEGGDVAADDWPEFMHDWLVEALRVTKPSGRLALNVPLDTTVGGCRPTYAEAVMAALDAGWAYKATLVWHEGNTTKGGWALGSQSSAARPHPVDSSEMIAIFGKGEWGPSSENPDDITPEEFLEAGRGPWTFSGESRAFEGHPAAFPAELPRRLIHLLCRRGDVVLDPFCGSGTTAAVAASLGRVFYGYDLSEDYVRSSQRRVVG